MADLAIDFKSFAEGIFTEAMGIERLDECVDLLHAAI